MMTVPLWVVLVVVGVGGAVGALLRHAAHVLGSPDSSRVRTRIIAVNIVGAFFAGVLAASDHPLALAATVGLFGSLTTWSTIAVWVAEDVRNREPVRAVTLAVWHILAGVAVVLAGFYAGQFVL